MLVEETEAHKYRCCQNIKENCVGRLCMAWKTYYRPQFSPNGTRHVETTKGYCGLSGKGE